MYYYLNLDSMETFTSEVQLISFDNVQPLTEDQYNRYQTDPEGVYLELSL